MSLLSTSKIYTVILNTNLLLDFYFSDLRVWFLYDDNNLQNLT